MKRSKQTGKRSKKLSKSQSRNQRRREKYEEFDDEAYYIKKAIVRPREEREKGRVFF